MREVVNEIYDTTCRKLTRDEILKCYKRWQSHYGKNKALPDESNPTEDQLSAMNHLVNSGDLPYASFAIFGPYGSRLMRKQKVMGLIIDTKGQLKQVEFLGPQTFSAWKASFNVMANAFILLGSVDPGTIDEYRAYHQRFYDKLGDMTWAIQYQADVRMRSERMLRLLRTAQASHEKTEADRARF